MKKIMLLCLTLVAFAVATHAQTRGAKSKIEAQTRATTPSTSTPTQQTPPSTTTGRSTDAGRPAKESKESQEAADQKDRDGDNGQGEGGGDKVKNLLGLSDEQNTQFRAIVVEVRQAIKAVRKDQTVAQGDKMSKIKAINDDRDAKLKNIFTPEQFTKWLELAKNKGGMGKGAGKGGRKSDN